MGPFGQVDQEHVEALELLILEHERIIEGYQQRLDEISQDSDGLNSKLIQSQIEFFLLNVRTLLFAKEAELKGARAWLKHMEERPPQPYPTAPAFPPPPPVDAEFVDDPPGGFLIVRPEDFKEIAARLRKGCQSVPFCSRCGELASMLERFTPDSTPDFAGEPVCAPADGQAASGGNKTSCSSD